MKFLLHGQESERLFFRKIQESDFTAWLPFHQDPETSLYWKGLPKNPQIACTEDFERTFFRYDNNLGGKMALISKSTKELVGLSGLLVQDVDGSEELEIAYSLVPKFWKQGYAIEAAQQCKLHAKVNKLAKSLISIIQVDNLPSQKVALNNGMRLDLSTDYYGNPVHIYRIVL
jgi:RimJ/RimL family protein N-acetyltransferase